jgi:hydroxypyruvate isomerase
VSFKQAVSHWCIPQALGTIEDCKKIIDIGITGVEMPPRERWDLLRQAGFTIATIAGHASLPDGLNKKENHSRIADELRANMEFGKQYGIPKLICFSGNREGKSEEEGMANTIEGLKLVAKDAEQAGITLILELLNSKVDHKDYQCDHTAWGAQVVTAVNSPAVRLLYDIYHMQIMEGDLIRNIRDNIQHIAHFHTAGNPGRKDLDEHQEINYPAVARAIKETGYNDWIGHEFMPKSDPVAALKQAYDAVAV